MVAIVIAIVTFLCLFLIFCGLADYADKMAPHPRLIPLGVLRFVIPHYPYGVPYKEAVTRKIWDRGPFLRREFQTGISANVLWMLLCMAASSLIVVVAQFVAFAYPDPFQQFANYLCLFNTIFCFGIGIVFSAVPNLRRR
jgi:dipeptide/tripeptide permease